MAREASNVTTGLFDFSLLSREIIVPLASTYSNKNADILLSFYFGPTVHPLYTTPNFTGAEDFRVYLDENDVSAQISALLNSRCSERDPNTLKSQYLAGVTAYLNTLKSLNLHQAETANDAAVATSYAAKANWARAFDKLGDHSFGWNGNLHPIYFIYRFMDIGPISMSDLLEAYNAQHGASLRPADIKRITFCQRGASFAGPFSNLPLGGRLFYKIETLYTHPMDDIIKQITKQLTDIAYKLELLRTQYLEPATERIARVEQDVGAAAGSTQASLDRLTQAVQNIHP